MTLGSYFMIALVIATCIPVIKFLANWYYRRIGLTAPWRSVPSAYLPQAVQSDDSYSGYRYDNLPDATWPH